MLLIAFLAEAQAGPGMGCARGCYGADEETVHGVAEALRNDTRFCRWGATEVALKTDKGTVTVLLGPALFLSRSGFAVAESDELSVTGFRLAPGQDPVPACARSYPGGQNADPARRPRNSGVGRSRYELEV